MTPPVSNSRTWLWVTLACTCIAVACSDDDKPANAPMATSGGSPGGDGDENLGGDSASLGGSGDGGGVAPIPSTDGVCAGVMCGQNQGCFPEGGFATCKCLSGFSGPNCQDVNECSTPSRCGDAGVCKNYQGTFSCQCQPGSADGGSGCEDLDECELGTHACSENAVCEDAVGTHLCTCSPGLYGDGTFCKAENDCSPNPCGGGTCRNTPSGFACTCPLGTRGPTCEIFCDPEEEIEFESSILEAAVRSSAGIVGDITPDKLAGQTTLFAPPPDSSLATDDEIRSLDGLECWSTLKTLNLRGHGVRDLDAIRHLAALSDVNLACAEAEDLSPLSGLPVLRTLHLGKGALCTDNQRDSLDLGFLAELTALRELNLAAAGFITDLGPLASLKRLHTLDVRGTDAPDLDALSGLTQLYELTAGQNLLTDLSPLGNLPHLRKLHMAMGNVSNLAPLEGLGTLEDLDLSSNAVSDIGPLSELEALQLLDLANNDIVDLSPLSDLSQLIVIELSQNPIVDVAQLSGNLNLSGGQLWIEGASFDCEDVASDFDLLLARGVTIYSDCN